VIGIGNHERDEDNSYATYLHRMHAQVHMARQSASDTIRWFSFEVRATHQGEPIDLRRFGKRMISTWGIGSL
jgi:hypothetical protein